VSAPAAAVTGDLALVEPVTPAWVVGSIGVAYDEAADQVVLVIEEVAEQGDEETDESAEEAEEAQTGPEAEGGTEPDPEEASETGEGDRASGRVRLTRPQVAAFVERARALVEAGRPTCRFCGRPINLSGHRCARTNGHGSD
jgi:uncharacterized repeat protein (TIGR03847 family)